MKVALLGDIHGNHFALAAVLEAVRRRDGERLLITGDFVGYYFWPGEVFELLSRWEFIAVRGNHEDMLAEARKSQSFAETMITKYGSGLRAALHELEESQIEMLCSLPHPLSLDIEGRRIFLCHGSPHDNGCYVYPDADQKLVARCAIQGNDLVVMGHTHYPMLRHSNGVRLVNPGSVGQPRNRRPGAYWALFDTCSGDLSFHKELYDSSRVVFESRQRHPEIPYLAEVLERT